MPRDTNNSVQTSFDTMSHTYNSTMCPINITPFSGDPEQLEYFITQVKDLASLNKWVDKHTLAYTRSKLQGQAHTFIIQRSTYENLNSTNDLFSALRAQFRQQNVCKSINEFNSLVMLPGESIRNLTHRLDAIAPRAHQSVKDKKALEAIKFNKFIGIVPNEYRKAILQDNIAEYNEAVEKATLLQDCDISNEIICQTTSAAYSHTPMQNIQSELNTIKESLHYLTQNSANNNNTEKSKTFHHKDKFHQQKSWQKYRNNQPYKSGRYDNNFKQKRFFNRHPQPKQQQIPEVQQFTNPTPSASNSTHLPMPPMIICQFCNQVGHSCRFCPSFKNFFVPRNNIQHINNHLALPAPASMPLPSSSGSTHVLNQSPQNVNSSTLNPDAIIFQHHPNW